MNDYEFEDARDPTKTTGAADGDDEDYGENDYNDDGGTSSTPGWSRELERRLRDFEVRSRSLVRDMYRRKGWMHSTDHRGRRPSDDDDEGFFSDSDSEEDDAR